VEQDEKSRLPELIYANLVGFNINSDDVLLEFWEHRAGHMTPAISADEIAKTRPVARIIVPFTSIRTLKDQLVALVAVQEKNRKDGQ